MDTHFKEKIRVERAIEGIIVSLTGVAAWFCPVVDPASQNITYKFKKPIFLYLYEDKNDKSTK